MKARINKPKEPQQKVQGFIELNKKFGHGFQGRLILSIGGDRVESVLDAEPFDFATAYAGMYEALEEVKRSFGYTYESHKIIHVLHDGIEANKLNDWYAGKVYTDIQEGKGKLTTPFGADFRREVINGREEDIYTPRGALLMVYLSWYDDKKPKARLILQKYCEYLAANRYGGGASEIFAELDGMDVDNGSDWIKATYGKYVKNDYLILDMIKS